MMYRRGSFTVPVSSGKGEMCKEKGHSATDGKGRCFCCGEKIAPPTISATPDGTCSRCKKPIEGFRPPDDGMTAGYYLATAWAKYANSGKVIICDACMWADPLYIIDYGPTHQA
jgi:hypothetical protein